MASALPIPGDCCTPCDTCESDSINDLINAALATVAGTTITITAIETLPDLRASFLHTDKMFIYLMGSVTETDGLGGIYVFDAASTDTDDDTSIIKPNDIAPASPGRWIKKL